MISRATVAASSCALLGGAGSSGGRTVWWGCILAGGGRGRGAERSAHPGHSGSLIIDMPRGTAGGVMGGWPGRRSRRGWKCL